MDRFITDVHFPVKLRKINIDPVRRIYRSITMSYPSGISPLIQEEMNVTVTNLYGFHNMGLKRCMYVCMYVCMFISQGKQNAYQACN